MGNSMENQNIDNKKTPGEENSERCGEQDGQKNWEGIKGK